MCKVKKATPTPLTHNCTHKTASNGLNSLFGRMLFATLWSMVPQKPCRLHGQEELPSQGSGLGLEYERPLQMHRN